MFTTGSKFLFGVAVGATVAWLVYGFTTESWPMLLYYGINILLPDGWVSLSTPSGTAPEVLFWLSLAAMFIGGVVLYVRDNEPVPWAKPVPRAPRTRSATSPAAWPVLTAFGAGLVALGLVSTVWLTVLGGVVLFAMLVEWVVQAWSDRASDDPAYNASVRGRLLHPFEFPLLAVAIIGFVVYFFSRIMLAIPAMGAVWLFIGLASAVLLVAVYFGYRKGPASKQMASGALVFGAVAMLALGVIGINQGQREIHEHDVEELEVEDANEDVSDQASVFARLAFNDGALSSTELEIPRSLNAILLFENHDDGARALVIHGGTETIVDENGVEVERDIEWSTGPVDEDLEGSVVVIFAEPGEFEFEVVGEGGVEASGVIHVL